MSLEEVTEVIGGVGAPSCIQVYMLESSVLRETGLSPLCACVPLSIEMMNYLWTRVIFRESHCLQKAGATILVHQDRVNTEQHCGVWTALTHSSYGQKL